MVTAAAEMPPLQKLRATLGIGISLAGVACAMTLLYLGMRAVMGVGGFCAEGGAFEIRQHCPQGIPGIMLGAIWGGIAMVGLYVWQTMKHQVPSLIGLAWPALFLSLGWNFLDFGLNPPGEESGVVWGWLICAILFILMGGLPLLGFGKMVIQQFFTDEPIRRPPSHPFVARTVLRDMRAARKAASDLSDAVGDTGAGTTSWGTASQGNDEDSIVVALERLAELHRSGELSDVEYEAAKQRLLRP